MRPDGPTAHHPELALPRQGQSSKSHLLPRPWACAWGSLEDVGSVLRQRESKRRMR